MFLVGNILVPFIAIYHGVRGRSCEGEYDISNVILGVTTEGT
jgi:hypothetical protein